ncbi:MAG: hypothetical protein SP1CHLAM42_13960 [Chlamydiales bacterium]|nr:hypothetical protein [Chlamydiales bacterium]
MKAKIDQNIICIPPYISTTWDQITFLHSEESVETGRLTLTLHLSSGEVISVPNLDPSIVDIAFSAHLKFMEQRRAMPAGGDMLGSLKMGIPGIENLADMMQHDLSKSGTPDLPKDVLERISSMAKMMTGGDMEAFPKPEPHCNCTHCQLAKAIHGKHEEELEPVLDEELTFRSWDIQQNGDNLYLVSNPTDPAEQYNVYLGTPVGCTCGHDHCEHIKAVLSS